MFHCVQGVHTTTIIWSVMYMLHQSEHIFNEIFKYTYTNIFCNVAAASHRFVHRPDSYQSWVCCYIDKFKPKFPSEYNLQHWLTLIQFAYWIPQNIQYFLCELKLPLYPARGPHLKVLSREFSMESRTEVKYTLRNVQDGTCLICQGNMT